MVTNNSCSFVHPWQKISVAANTRIFTNDWCSLVYLWHLINSICIFALSCGTNQHELVTAQQIWEGVKAGDVTALQELYQLYHQDLFSYGKKMTKDEQLVEDALQETFIAIWKYRLTAQAPAAVKQYVLKVFRNQLLRLFRERSTTIYTGESLNFSFEVSFDQKIIEGEDTRKLSADINKALQQLTSRQREIIYYRFNENLTC